MKKANMGLPDPAALDPNTCRIDEFIAGVEKCIKDSIQQWLCDAPVDQRPDQATFEKILTKTQQLLEGSYACGYQDGVIEIMKLLAAFIDETGAVYSSSIDPNALQEYMAEHLQMPLPDNMELGEVLVQGLRFTYDKE